MVGLQNTYGSRDQNNDVINQHLLSRSIAGINFSFIPCVEVEIPGGEAGFTLTQATSGIMRGKLREGLTHFQLHTLIHFRDLFLNI